MAITSRTELPVTGHPFAMRSRITEELGSRAGGQNFGLGGTILCLPDYLVPKLDLAGNCRRVDYPRATNN
jgi:hypothetical protein